ncbi:large ribosomal subunit protein mL64 isoform X1 [Panulirus ornatus]|uniref:large ribosomal subunit protein mL64 isoform X1 n=1 Tax=Panulirus ornatus TaxID=150431 RepID=UPI003A891B16
MIQCRPLPQTLLKWNRDFVRQTWRPLAQQTSLAAGDAPDQNDQDLIDEKRNRSGLKPRHYMKYHNKPQLLTDDEEQVLSLSSQRKLYGEYGAASGISISKLWPSKEELRLNKEWESIAYPHSIHQMIELERKKKQEEELRLKERQEDLVNKMAKLEGWKKVVRDRIAKKEKEAQDAKAKKERLIEEVRQIFGFRIDPRDDRFKDALLQKEREEKKASKAAKKLARQQRMIERLKTQVVEESPVEKASASGSGYDEKNDPPNTLSGSSVV